ncbi:MAG: high-potential iron-sulfur protein [Woeseiaceae bacterium]|nr:high-potential iron-sulfur protein [Woeseiaceae bacterium]
MPKRDSKTQVEIPMTRRQFVRSAGAAAAVAAAGLTPRPTAASDLPRVSEDDPMAISLNYVHDAGNADAAKRASDSYCYNCVLYAGAAEDEWAGCSVFPGKAVAGKGWCSVWAKK